MLGDAADLPYADTEHTLGAGPISRPLPTTSLAQRRRHAARLKFLLLIPLIGVLVYLIARGGSMNERAAQQAQQQDQEFRSYVQEAAADSPASTADQLAKLADLRDRGVISAQEFEHQKAKVLAA